MYKIILFIASVIIIFPSIGQEIETKASFLDDSVKVGMPIGFSIVTTYASNLDLLFPDSAANYAPYEFEGKIWHPTQTVGNTSKDSLVYYLRTYEIDSIQEFQLIYYLLDQGDSVRYQSPSDQFALIHTVKDTPDSLSGIFLQEDTEYYRIDKSLNYPFLIAGLVIVFVLAIGFWLAFGKQIKQRIALRRMQKANERFIETYSLLIDGLRPESLPVMSENILIHWKKYMEKLEPVPYRKLTTKELSTIENNELLIDSLQEIDKAIYSRGQIDQVVLNLKNLKNYSQVKYEEKLEEVQHGGSK